MTKKRRSSTSKRTPSEPIKSPPDRKRRPGRPPKQVLQIDDTPLNVARSLFGIKSDKIPPKDTEGSPEDNEVENEQE